MQFKSKYKPARVLLSADSPQFNTVTIGHWREEGFTVSYLPFSGSQKEYAQSLRAIAEPLGFREEFALVGTLSFPEQLRCSTIAITLMKY